MDDWRTTLLDVLDETIQTGGIVTYRDLAARSGVPGPGRIAKVTGLLEQLVLDDHAAGRPLRAAVAVSRARDRLPGPGFFRFCREAGLYFGPEDGPQARLFHDLELRRVHAYNSRVCD